MPLRPNHLVSSLCAILWLACAGSASSQSSTPIPLPEITGVDNLYSHDGKLYVNFDFGYYGRMGKVASGNFVVINVGTGAIAMLPDIKGEVVKACTPDGQGGWFIGGRFNIANGPEAQLVAHVMADGSIDPAWNQPIFLADEDELVNCLEYRNGILYCGGSFSMQGDSQTGLNLASFDTSTAALTNWSPAVDGEITCLASDETRLYAGGPFTTVNAQPRGGICAFDVGSGQLENWTPAPHTAPGVIKTIAVMDENVFLGGGSEDAFGTTRLAVAGFNKIDATGNGFSYNANGNVRAFTFHKNFLAVAGEFTSFGGKSATHGALVDLSSKAVTANSAGRIPDCIAGNDTTIYGDAEMLMFYLVQPFPEDFEPPSEPVGDIKTMALEGDLLAIGGTLQQVVAVHSPLVLDAAQLTVEPSPFMEGVRQVCGATVITELLPGRHSVGAVYAQDRETGEIRWELESDLVDCACHEDTVFTSRGTLRARALATGELLPWTPTTNGSVRTLLVHEGVLYFGGGFTTVNDVPRNGLAAFDLSTLELTPWSPDFGKAEKLIFEDGTFYAGRSLSSNAAPDRVFAAIAFDGTVSWLGDVIGSGISYTETICQHRSELGCYSEPRYIRPAVDSIASFDDRICIAGVFETVGDEPRIDIASVSPDGTVSGWRPNNSTALTVSVSADYYRLQQDETSLTVAADKLFMISRNTLKAFGALPEFQPPAGPGLSDVQPEQLTLTWSDDSATDTGINIYFSTTSELPQSPTRVAGPEETEALFDGLTPNTQYHFQLSAFRPGEETQRTSVLSVFTRTLPPAMGQNIQGVQAPGIPYPVGTSFTFTNPAGFGVGEHGGQTWNSGDISLLAPIAGRYQLELTAVNGNGVQSDPVTFGPYLVWSVPGGHAHRLCAQRRSKPE